MPLHCVMKFCRESPLNYPFILLVLGEIDGRKGICSKASLTVKHPALNIQITFDENQEMVPFLDSHQK